MSIFAERAKERYSNGKPVAERTSLKTMVAKAIVAVGKLPNTATHAVQHTVVPVIAGSALLAKDATVKFSKDVASEVKSIKEADKAPEIVAESPEVHIVRVNQW